MDAGTKLYWESFNEHYTTSLIIERTLNQLNEYIDDFIEGPIIDIGCGQSHFLLQFSRMKRELFALDEEPTQLEMLKKRVEDLNESNVASWTYLNSRFPDQPLPDRKFAVVIMSNYLHFFAWEQCQVILHTIRERTQVGSLVYVSVHSKKHYRHIPDDPQSYAYFKHYFSLEELTELFAECGFTPLYTSEIQRVEGMLDKFVREDWLKRYFNAYNILSAFHQDQIRTQSFGHLESDIVAIFRREH